MKIGYAKCDDVESISEQRLIAQLGTVSDVVIVEIATALRFLLNL
jgi:mRNA-degrading endonuclease toxin of MazEF toxin-antitoxin module